jgi:hypothetical protein
MGDRGHLRAIRLLPFAAAVDYARQPRNQPLRTTHLRDNYARRRRHPVGMTVATWILAIATVALAIEG